MQDEDIKILGVIDEDPFHYRTWSGSSAYFFSALRRGNHLCDAISAEPCTITRYKHKLASFHPHINGWKFKYRLNTDYYKEMTRTAVRKIESLNAGAYNVVLQVGAYFDLVKNTNKLTVSYHDGNLWALLKSPYGYPQIKRKYVERALAYEKKVYENVHHIFTMSQWLARSFMEDFGVEARKISVIGAGINLPYVGDVTERSYDQPNVLFVGIDFERKGGKDLIEAFKRVREEIKGATLTIIGPRLNELPDGVRCLNYVSKFEEEGIWRLIEEYRQASVFVLPSLYEPFGIAFAEAMAHKVPCIGTNVCAIPEIINDGVSGYVVPVKDSRSLGRRIIELLKDREQCREFGENGFKRYHENYTWDIVARRMVDRITELS